MMYMTTMNTTDFFAPAMPLVQAFNAWAEQASPSARADHVCYKCASAEEFERLRALFEHESDFIYQSIISGRRIAIIRFREPIVTPLGDITILELADQKPNGEQISGFDHIEIYPTEGSVEALAERLSSLLVFEKIVRPHHTTYDAVLTGAFKVRLEQEPLVEKIKKEEMRDG
ncbi:MAG: hypothetical protein RL141_1007 [Candidatus Parcubacteria bacterium]|jgi:predicted metalloenzyme YecM